MTTMASRVARPIEAIRVEVDGTALAVFGCGPASPDGPSPIVFLHAAVADSRSWAAQFERFGADRRVVAYDRRGFGETTASTGAFSSVDDLWSVMDALAVGQAVLVGCSQGGRIALDATLERPDRVAALVLSGAAISGAPEPAMHDLRLDGPIAAFEKAKATADLEAQNRIEARLWLDGPFVPEGRVGGAARELFLEMNRIALDGPDDCGAEVRTGAYAHLSEVAVPTLVLWGTLDLPSVIVNMTHAAATIPGARRCAMDDVAHLPSLEAPERFDAALAGFLDSLASR